MNEESMANALYHVRREMNRAEKTHGPFSHGVIRGVAILTEEVGEVAAEALVATRAATGSHQGATGTREALIAELAQVAGVALNMIVKLEEEGYQL